MTADEILRREKRYSTVTEKLFRRYGKYDRLVLAVDGKPSKFKRLIDLAYKKFME
jgi:formylmethanofuran dehydrogenase subunit B